MRQLEVMVSMYCCLLDEKGINKVLQALFNIVHFGENKKYIYPEILEIICKIESLLSNADKNDITQKKEINYQYKMVRREINIRYINLYKLYKGSNYTSSLSLRLGPIAARLSVFVWFVLGFLISLFLMRLSTFHMVLGYLSVLIISFVMPFVKAKLFR